MSANQYDVVVIGAGPAGLTAALFACRHSLKTLVLEQGNIGGQLLLAVNIVKNWPGTEGSGPEIMKAMEKQAREAGAEITQEAVVDLNFSKGMKVVRTAKREIKAKAVIIATGAAHRKLNIAGEDKFIGKGVSYCVGCDGPLFQDKSVAVVGGSDTAVNAAIYLSKIAKQTYLVHRRHELRAEEANQAALKKTKVKIVWDSIPIEVKGSGFVNAIVLEDVNTKKQQTIDADGIFIYVGNIPSTELASKAGVKLDEKGFIITDKNQETNVKGVFAAGDCTGGLLQAAKATGEGATAAINAYAHIKEQK